jgi:hypothetical protein
MESQAMFSTFEKIPNTDSLLDWASTIFAGKAINVRLFASHALGADCRNTAASIKDERMFQAERLGAVRETCHRCGICQGPKKHSQ